MKKKEKKMRVRFDLPSPERHFSVFMFDLTAVTLLYLSRKSGDQCLFAIQREVVIFEKELSWG